MRNVFDFIAQLLISTLSVTLLISVSYEHSFAASATSSVSQVVLASTSVTKISDFSFPSKNFQNRETNAQYRLAGTPNNTFTIMLPQNNIFLKSSNKLKSVELRGLQSYPLGSTKIDKNGKQNLRISIAKMPKLSKSDKNSYSGSFTIDVVY